MSKSITNILDYLKWRGDLSFASDPFNEIDALVLSRFSYLDLNGIVDNEGNEITVTKAQEIYASSMEGRGIYREDDPLLFELMAKDLRFKDLKLSYHINRFNENKVEQFASVTISIDDNSRFISFRGTDNTINGWKEDLLMTFDDKIPSQEDAINYLNMIAIKYPGDIYIGGHSKGGNLAIYSALFCEDIIASRIKFVYSFDGPGLHDNLLKEVEGKKILPNIVTYVPQSSIFGKMLGHQEQMVIVHSNAIGALQHDIYSWSVTQKNFHIVSQDTATSRAFDQAFHDYLAKLSKEEREDVVNIIFDAIDDCDIETVDDLTKHFIFNLIKVMRHLNHLDKDDGKLIKEAIAILGDSLKDAIFDEISDIIPFFKKDKED